MKMIDQNGKLFGKINIMDSLIILLVILSIAVVYMRFIRQNEGTEVTADRPVIIRVETEYALRDYHVATYQIGDPLYFKNTDTRIGEILKTDQRNFREAIIKTNGEAVMADSPDSRKLLLEFAATATKRGDDYFINGNISVAIGSSLDISTQIYRTMFRITGIEPR